MKVKRTFELSLISKKPASLNKSIELSLKRQEYLYTPDEIEDGEETSDILLNRFVDLI